VRHLRGRFSLVVVVVWWAFVFGRVVAASASECDLPASLGQEFANKYPGATVVKSSDLDEHSKAIFVKDQGDRCPGLVKVDFYGDGNLVWALVIVPPTLSNGEAKLVVARRSGSAWELTLLDSAKGSVPVVWSLGPGKYRDVYGGKSIEPKTPAIVWGEYESCVILYAWKGKSAAKIWLVD
jgi:hypothetical protein